MKNTLHCKSQLKRAQAAPNVPAWESLPCIVSYLDNLRLLSNLQSWGLTRVCVWQREEQTEKGFTLHAAGVIPDNFILNSFQLSWRSSVHPGHYFNIFPVLQFIAVSWFFNHYLHESFHSTPAHLHSLFFFFYKKAIQGSWSDWNFMLLRTYHFEEKITTYYSLPPCSVTHSINLFTI